MNKKIKEAALETLTIEAVAVEKLKERINDDFVDVVQCVLDCKARVIITGMGKSGHIGRKMAATFASTGTPAFFMHPGEAFHGDLGMVTENDVVIAISNSGESMEVVNILPIIRRIGATIIAMCGRRDSQLGKVADHFLDIGVEKEACPLGLAPTASTTATLAMGDALAIALMSVRDFTRQDFALFHPGGALGRKLLLTVKNVMHTGDDNPLVHRNKTVKDALFIMTDKGLGAASVIDDSGKLVGIITDGIIRRALAKDYKFLDEAVGNIMFETPITIKQEAMASAALSVMEKHKPRPVTVLPVINQENVPVGIVHLTDLLKNGVM